MLTLHLYQDSTMTQFFWAKWILCLFPSSSEWLDVLLGADYGLRARYEILQCLNRSSICTACGGEVNGRIYFASIAICLPLSLCF